MSDYDAAFEGAMAGAGGAPQKGGYPRGTPKRDAPVGSEYDDIMASLMPKAQAAPAEVPTVKPKGSGNDLIDKGNAIGTGYFRGLTALAGLPVDTVANVLDLGKAAIGAPYIALTGKAPPAWLEPADRKQVVGSGAYLTDKATKTSAGRTMLEAINPEYQGGYLQGAGGALNGVMRPATAAQGINQALNSVLGATAGKATYDATGSTALAIAAGMSPTALQSAGSEALKYGIRGGEAGRKAMEQRIQTLKEAGVNNPTMGLASGNQLLGGVENLLQNTPGAVGVMRQAREGAVSGMQAKADQAAGRASTNRGSLESGVAIQSGIDAFKGRFVGQQEALYNKMDASIPPLTPVNVGNTKATMGQLNADIPGAPEVSKQFKNARIDGLARAFEADTTAPMPMPTMLRPTGGLGTLPFEAVKKTRTLVGKEVAENSLINTVSRDKWNALYGALSGDMKQAAAQAGPKATGAFNRATDFTRAGIERLDRVAPFYNKDAPEQSFQMLNRTLGDNVSTLQAVKKTLPEGARGTIAGTVIERLGTSTAGQQNAGGTAWSPETFLTNWNKMKPEARTELLSGFPNAAQVKRDVSAVADAASMMRDNSRLWANPSGTSANLAARGLLGAVGAGGAASVAGLLSPAVPLMAGGGLLASNQLAKGLTNQKYVNSAAQRSYIDPEMLNAQALSLFGGGLLEQR